jgi:hypothetical protein
MLVLVAIHAFGKSNFVKRVFAFGNMALDTRHGGMLALERIGAGCVLLQVELRGFEAVDGMACRTLDAGGSLGKLAVVNVLVALRTLLEDEWLLEIASLVAGQAIDGLVLSQQGISGFGVVEFLVDVFQRNPFPPAGAVARLASLRKTSFVRIAMTVGALAKNKAYVTRLVVRTRRMALLTIDLRMQTGQRIFGFVVIKLVNVLPVLEIVTLLAVGAEAAIVFVFMTGGASLGQP